MIVYHYMFKFLFTAAKTKTIRICDTRKGIGRTLYIGQTDIGAIEKKIAIFKCEIEQVNR